jgi:hypothetical protein
VTYDDVLGDPETVAAVTRTNLALGLPIVNVGQLCNLVEELAEWCDELELRLEEMEEELDFAKEVVRNATTLAQAQAELGLDCEEDDDEQQP